MQKKVEINKSLVIFFQLLSNANEWFGIALTWENNLEILVTTIEMELKSELCL